MKLPKKRHRADLDKPIVQFIPPMELHILLGLGNDLFRYLKVVMIRAGFKVTLERWAKQIGVKESQYHSGAFNGNMMERVLTQGSAQRLRMLLSRDLTPKIDDIPDHISRKM